MQHNFTVYHTQEKRSISLGFPILAEGSEQWLGDGFYFWQDYELAKWWGYKKKCLKANKSNQFSVYTAVITFNDDEFVDTVFNEQDYYQFVEKIEKFAKLFIRQFKKKPTLVDFNDFIKDFNIWDEIKVIRFQDLPANNDLIEVDGFYYKKRIQFRINEPQKITNFAHFKDFYCLSL